MLDRDVYRIAQISHGVAELTYLGGWGRECLVLSSCYLILGLDTSHM